MPSYKPYHREQAALLPAHVQDVLGENHLCFLVHDMVEQLDLSAFEARAALPSAPYDDGMTVRLCLAGEEHAQAGATHSRRLGVSLFSGRHSPDHKTLNEFLRLHGKAVMQLFTQVLQLLRQAGVARLGEVAIDSTRIKGRASRDRVVRRTELECKVQQWMSELDEDPDRQPGREVSTGERQRVQEQLRQMRDSGEDKLSVTDADARFLRERQGFVLGYTGEIAVSEDHFIVAQRVNQNKNDNGSLLPMGEEVERHCRQAPHRVLADRGFFSRDNVQQLEERGLDGYLADSNLARELIGLGAAQGIRSSLVMSLPQLPAG